MDWNAMCKQASHSLQRDCDCDDDHEYAELLPKSGSAPDGRLLRICICAPADTNPEQTDLY